MIYRQIFQGHVHKLALIELSTFFNIKINFDRHTNTTVRRGQTYPELTHKDRPPQAARRIVREHSQTIGMLGAKGVDSGLITDILKRLL